MLSGSSRLYCLLVQLVILTVASAECAFAPDASGHVTIPDGTTKIEPGKRGFAGCEMTSISMPQSVTSIGNGAFSNCKSLKSIVISNKVTFVQASTFQYCESLESVTFGSAVTKVGHQAFGTCQNLLNATFLGVPSDVNKDWAYECSKLARVVIACPEGKHQSSPFNIRSPLSCSSCEKHTYQPNIAREFCISCPDGYFQDFVGKTSCGNCASMSDPKSHEKCQINLPGSKCLAGGFSINTWRNPPTCDMCSRGTFSNANATLCTSCAAIQSGFDQCAVCAPGFFVEDPNAIGKKRCRPCSRQHYANQPEQMVCYSCPSGKYQDKPSQSYCETHVVCTPGFFIANFSNYGDERCKQCPPQFYSNKTEQMACYSCPNGKYQPRPSQSYCESCLPGMFQPKGNNCVGCPKGKFSDTAGSECRICPHSYFQDNERQSFCSPIKICSPGSYIANPLNNSDGRCGSCPRGYHRLDSNAGACLRCPKGRYSNITGSAICNSCAAGKYNPDEGADSESKCIVCAQGRYAALTGSAEITDCTACTPGWVVRNRSGGVASAGGVSCNPCKKGWYSPNPHTECLFCAPGSVTDTLVAAGATTCSQCKKGKFSTNSHGGCENCKKGKYLSSVGASAEHACIACDPGHYTISDGSDTGCIECKAGSVTNHLKGNGSSVCSLCEEGRFSPRATEECASCPAGSVTNTLSGPGATTCEACGVGQYSTDATIPCTTCSSGRYAEKMGSSTVADCLICAKDNKCLGGKRTSCTQGEGEYQDEQGMAFCKTKRPCLPGMFDRTSGVALSMARCKACPRNYFRLNNDELFCLRCPNGKHQQHSGKPFCSSCQPGMYLPMRSNQTCQTCPTGYFASISGKPSCDLCPGGYYQNAIGKAYCDETKSDSLMKPVFNEATGKMTLKAWKCVAGIKCDGKNRQYLGNVWHNTLEEFPAQSNMYTCVLDGCPDKGATEMKCKEGFEPLAPLCAICADGYFEQLRSCVKCEDPRIVDLVLFVLGLILLIVLGMYFFHHYNHVLTNEIVANFKITISFITIVSTMKHQFGIAWPPMFLSALATLTAITFDLTVLSGVFCLVKVSFFTSLVFNTASLVVVVAVCYACSKFRPEWGSTCDKTVVYVLLFAYPVVSVKCIEAFSCHVVDGQPFLRADYSVSCNSSTWKLIAGYASIFVVMYVALLPVCVLGVLYRYRKQVKGQTVVPRGLRLGFLLEDYCLVMPCLLWDGVEMLRKLGLSVVGSFWSSQSAMAIATAFVISLGFLSLHQCYQPFKSRLNNRVQQCCLFAVSLIYFAGLLLKVHAVEASTIEGIDGLLVFILVLTFCIVLYATIQQVITLLNAIRRARYCSTILQRLPQHDPPADSDEFYLIQIPVERNNMGGNFQPKLPHLLSHISNQKKVEFVHQLSAENEPRLKSFFDKLEKDWMVRLKRVKQSHDVDEYGKIAVKFSHKTDQSILAKAMRPSIRAENPKFSVEHVRDTFRFKGVVFSFCDAIKFIHAMDKDRSLCPNGLSPDCVAKLDIEKMRTPKAWGWRFVAFDFVMPNFQIIECYIVMAAMEAAKKNEDPDAAVCPALSNHEIFELWRNEDTTQLDEDELIKFERHRLESNRRYDAAFASVIAHTSKAEYRSFWASFGVTTSFSSAQSPLHSKQLSTTKSGVGFSNPIFGSESPGGTDMLWAIGGIHELKTAKSGIGWNTNINTSSSEDDDESQEEQVEVWDADKEISVNGAGRATIEQTATL